MSIFMLQERLQNGKTTSTHSGSDLSKPGAHHFKGSAFSGPAGPGIVVTLLYTVLGLASTFQCPQVKSRVIQTKYGRVQGFGARVGRDASQQRYVEVFLGVPYASPPVGNKR